jgi:SAM-dependent methyltransferase
VRIAALSAGLLLAPLAGAQEGRIDVPFITTPPEVVAAMLELARTGPGDFVIDLGSGDGRIVIHAARAHGARGLGVDIDPDLVALASENAVRAGVADRVRFKVEDALRTDLSGASVVTAYLLPWLLDGLEPRMRAQMRPGARIVTHAFRLTGWPYDETRTVHLSARHAGQGDTSRLYLYVVPAQARGAWRAEGGWRLHVQQNFQQIDVQAWLGERSLAVRSARLSGERIEVSGPDFSFAGRVAGGRIAGELDGHGPLVFERAP